MRIMTKLRRRHALRCVATVLLAASAAACTDFLTVENPGAIEEGDVNNPTYVGLLVNGVIGEFQPAFSSVALYSAVFTDELANFHGFSENIDIDRRAVDLSNGTYNNGVYTPLHSARFMADTVSSLLRAFLADTASRDVRLARALAYGGYTYTLLGEQMCASPLNRSSRAFTPDELLDTALVRFTAAIDVATAARAYNAGITPATTTSQANVAGADSLLALARIGAARASLDLGRRTEAATHASVVVNNAALAATWGFPVYHSANSVRENNPFFTAASGGASAEWVAITNTRYESLSNDPRIPHPTTRERTQQGDAIVPNSPLMFSTYNGTAVGADFTREASVRFASKLEAQYIVAEAQGATAANVTFLNSRRAIGNDAALVAPTEPEFQAALREQRARDFYLTGYRLGDLRRYKSRYNVDLFETGAYRSPVPAPPTFGTQECWPIPQAEYTGNPTLPRP
jgi:hypothetical protein